VDQNRFFRLLFASTLLHLLVAIWLPVHVASARPEPLRIRLVMPATPAPSKAVVRPSVAPPAPRAKVASPPASVAARPAAASAAVAAGQSVRPSSAPRPRPQGAAASSPPSARQPATGVRPRRPSRWDDQPTSAATSLAPAHATPTAPAGLPTTDAASHGAGGFGGPGVGLAAVPEVGLGGSGGPGGRAWARPGPVVAKPRVAPHRRRAARSPRGQTDRRSRRSPGGTQTSAPQPAPKPAPAAPARPPPEPQPEPKPEAQPEAKPEPKPEAKPEPKPEPKPEAKDERPSRPQPLSRPQPSFSRAAREQLSGPVSVTVSITVSASGDVTSVSVTNSSGVGAIDSAAVSACHGWRFSAAKQGASFTQTFRIKPL